MKKSQSILALTILCLFVCGMWQLSNMENTRLAKQVKDTVFVRDTIYVPTTQSAVQSVDDFVNHSEIK